jgi:hypothetical protein
MQPCSHTRMSMKLCRQAPLPQRVQDIGVAVVDPEQLVRAARADHMHDQPERDQEPEDGLSDFPWWHPEAAPAPELMHRKRDVGRERRVQQ